MQSWQNTWRACITERQNETEALGNIFGKNIKDSRKYVSPVTINSSSCGLEHEHHTVDGLDLLFDLPLQHLY